MKVFNFIAKLAITIVILIIIEIVLTTGYVLNFHDYHLVAWIVQICFIIICIRLAIEDWGTWKN